MAVIKKTSAIKNSPKHLLGIQNLSILEAQKILNEAKAFIKLKNEEFLVFRLNTLQRNHFLSSFLLNHLIL